MTDTPERFISPAAPPTPRQRELLVILMEECAEVQQRAAKALRFGPEEVQPGQEHSNAHRLSVEAGQLLHVMERCMQVGVIDEGGINEGHAEKGPKLDKYMQAQP